MQQFIGLAKLTRAKFFKESHCPEFLEPRVVRGTIK
jgi:hypothetical protein